MRSLRSLRTARTSSLCSLHLEKRPRSSSDQHSRKYINFFKKITQLLTHKTGIWIPTLLGWRIGFYSRIRDVKIWTSVSRSLSNPCIYMYQWLLQKYWFFPKYNFFFWLYAQSLNRGWLWDPMDYSPPDSSVEFSRREYWSGLSFPPLFLIILDGK